MKNKNFLSFDAPQEKWRKPFVEKGALQPAVNPGALELRKTAGSVEETAAAGLGWLPALSLAAACGLLAIAYAYTGSRAGANWAGTVFWAGLLLLVLPLAARLAAAEASRRERLGLVTILGLGLYMVKILHSPATFTFSDELIHYATALDISENGHLFIVNKLLPVITYFPGLEAVTTALASLSGLTVFQAGLVVIGAARLVLALALFLFYEQISSSPRAAGIATMLYMANPNFIFWSAQFSYESLALPIAVLVVFAVSYRENIRDRFQRLGLTLLALIALTSVMITHHLTSYALAVFLIGASVFHTLFSKLYRKEYPDIWGLALVALVTAVTWLVYVASLTISYLSPIFRDALASMFRLVATQEAGRELFRSSTGELAPLWERAVGLGSVALLLIALPFGLYQIWRLYRQQAMVFLLAGAALAYFGMLGLRLLPAGWEIANRASEFLFVGLALVVALGAAGVWLPRHAGLPLQAMYTAFVAVVFMGGIIAGWLPKLRLAQPYHIAAGGQIIEPQGVAAAYWARDYIQPEDPIIATNSDVLLMMSYGRQHIIPSRRDDVNDMYSSPQFGSEERSTLRHVKPRFLLFNRRLISWNQMLGLYFNRVEGSSSQDSELFDFQAYAKFDRLDGVSKILETGTIAIYDVGEISGVETDQ